MKKTVSKAEKIKAKRKRAKARLHVAHREEDIPKLAARAVASAARRARTTGLSIVEANGCEIVRIAPDGSRSVIKTIEPGLRVALGKQVLTR